MPWDDESYTVSHAKKNEKSYIICYAKNIENHATFAEGFWAEFNARGRFMKYTMSVPWGLFLMKGMSLTPINGLVPLAWE